MIILSNADKVKAVHVGVAGGCGYAVYPAGIVDSYADVITFS